ncbi:MAG: flippase-like domain-containing protein [Candidatus Aenigmarchaeota archaeon]|nr:flippase-like domain-containing protein [Candidatus Aenigmarchaeota archaeon]
MRKRITVFLFSILVMLLTISLFGIGDVTAIVLASNLSLIFFAVLCQLIIFLLYAVRFKIMSSKYKNLSLKDAFYITTTGNFVSLITPIAKIGGQPLMIYLTKEKIGSAKSSAIVLMDTIIDIISSTLLVAVILILFRTSIPYPLFLPLLVFTLLTILVTAGFMKLFLSRKVLSRLLNWLLNKIRHFKKVNKIFHAHLFEKSFRLVLEDKKIMSAGMGLSFGIKFFELLRIWIIFTAIGIFLSPVTILVIWTVMLLLLTIPWLPGSLGLFEFGTSSALILLGLTSSQAAGGVLLDRFVSFWFVILFSVVVIWLSRYRLKEIIQLAEKK